MTTEYKEGDEYQRSHPFTLEDGDSDGNPDGKRWRPGAWKTVQIAPDDATTAYDEMGFVKYRIISVHKPGHYPTRIFYTRQFQCPDGTWYRKSGLLMCGVNKFDRMRNGVSFEYAERDTYANVPAQMSA